jgi:hypothetical protein
MCSDGYNSALEAQAINAECESSNLRERNMRLQSDIDKLVGFISEQHKIIDQLMNLAHEQQQFIDEQKKLLARALGQTENAIDMVRRIP